MTVVFLLGAEKEDGNVCSARRNPGVLREGIQVPPDVLEAFSFSFFSWPPANALSEMQQPNINIKIFIFSPLVDYSTIA